MSADPTQYISPLDPRTQEEIEFAPRLPSLNGRTIGLVDISKPGGEEFLDRCEQLLRSDYGVAEVVRLSKPIFSRPAPESVLSEAERCGAVVFALAD